MQLDPTFGLTLTDNEIRFLTVGIKICGEKARVVEMIIMARGHATTEDRAWAVGTIKEHLLRASPPQAIGCDREIALLTALIEGFPCLEFISARGI